MGRKPLHLATVLLIVLALAAVAIAVSAMAHNYSAYPLAARDQLLSMLLGTGLQLVIQLGPLIGLAALVEIVDEIRWVGNPNRDPAAYVLGRVGWWLRRPL